MKILAVILFSLICIVPGSKAGFFDGLPLSMPEMLIAFFILLGILFTPWEQHIFLKKAVLFIFVLFLPLQFFSSKLLPYGWNVCVSSEASASKLDSNCEPSLEFRHGEKSFIYDKIDFDKNSFPLYFFNDGDFNFYLKTQPKRNSLPFTLEASTYINPKEGDQLIIQSDVTVLVHINDVAFTTRGSKKPESVNLIPNIINHISLQYTARQNKGNILAIQLPENHFFETKAAPPNSLSVHFYRIVNTLLLFILASCFAHGFFQTFRSGEKRERVILSLFGVSLVLFSMLILAEIIDFQIATILFSLMLISSSLSYALSSSLIRKKILPFILLFLFAGSCMLTTSHIMPQQTKMFSGGNDELGHEFFARKTMLSTNFKEFASAAEPNKLYYYQPLHRYFLAAFHSIFGEPMWGVYVIQTFLFSLALLFATVILFESIGFAALIAFAALSLFLLSYPYTPLLTLIQTPYQQAVALPIFILALVQIARFIKNPNQPWGSYLLWGGLIGIAFMMRTDWLVTFSGIALSLLFIAVSPTLKPVTKLKSLASLLIGLSIFPVLIGLRNFYIAGKFAIMPTSGFVNLINELAVPLKERIPLHENSATVFAGEIIKLFDGRYGDLALILWNNIYQHVIETTIVREGLWSISAIFVAFSTILFFTGKMKSSSPYKILVCFSISFLSLIAVNSFFLQHNGMAMYGAYDFLLLLVLATGFQIISDQFGIIDYVQAKIKSHLKKNPSTATLSNKELSIFLQSNIPANAGLLDKIKIGYRPYICPFGDLLDIIPNHATVFDIGCGNGMFLSLVSRFKNPKALGGIEISTKLIDNATIVLKNQDGPAKITLQTFDGENLPEEIASYDYIFLIDVLHHIPEKDQVRFLEKMHEIMSPGSRLVLKDIDGGNQILSKFNKLHDLLLAGEIGHELSSEYVENKLAQIGFETSAIIKKRTLLYPHYTIICEKK